MRHSVQCGSVAARACRSFRGGLLKDIILLHAMLLRIRFSVTKERADYAATLFHYEFMLSVPDLKVAEKLAARSAGACSSCAAAHLPILHCSAVFHNFQIT